ncbi:MAG: hypothetical protein JXO44_14700 [Clostridia bacterium]|nr:hypothetical protein [Clostridia bacterium]
MKVIGSRNRKLFFFFTATDGETRTYRIRRLRCTVCHKIHHELPDFMVPFKRLSTEAISRIIEGNDLLQISSKIITNTFQWFEQKADTFIGLTKRICKHDLMEPVFFQPDETLSKLEWLKVAFSHHDKWLAHLVRMIVNRGLWPHTRMG